jgi:hypothetical protein
MAKAKEIRDILENKYNFALYHGWQNYFEKRTEFIDFIFENEEFSDVVRKIIIKRMVDRDWLQDVFNTYYILHKSLNGKEFETPVFWNKEFEKETNLMKNFLDLLTAEKERINEKKIAFNMEDSNPESFFDKDGTARDLSILKKFINDVILELDLVKSKKNLEKIQSKLALPVNPKKENAPSLNFDPNSSVLSVKGKNFKIKKFSDIYHILKIIFADKLGEDLFYSEIAERLDRSKDLPDSSIYNAIYQLKTRLKGSKLDDLFHTSKQSVLINKDYL